jgi:hypothetical protein
MIERVAVAAAEDGGAPEQERQIAGCVFLNIR